MTWQTPFCERFTSGADLPRPIDGPIDANGVPRDVFDLIWIWGRRRSEKMFRRDAAWVPRRWERERPTPSWRRPLGRKIRLLPWRSWLREGLDAGHRDLEGP